MFLLKFLEHSGLGQELLHGGDAARTAGLTAGIFFQGHGHAQARVDHDRDLRGPNIAAFAPFLEVHEEDQDPEQGG